MDSTLRRLEDVETDVSKLRIDLKATSSQVPHLATKAEIQDLKTDISNVRYEIASKENKRLYEWVIFVTVIWLAAAFAASKFL